jgi:hypothetical protein
MKRIACCLDGAWDSELADSQETNVAKLHGVIAASDGHGVRQLSHYLGGKVSGPRKAWRFLEGDAGSAVGERIRAAYRLLAEDYEPGDEIHLFGFSRGAFEARSLAALIGLIGIAKANGSFPIERAWGIYRLKESARDPAMLAEIRRASHYPVRIKCIGIWDTIGSVANRSGLGGALARRHAFHDMRLGEHIEVGLHALSIDELRGRLRPSLWTLPKGSGLAADQQIEQVWFPGTHGDVGGGHRETGLSDVALLWMVERVRATTGLAFDVERLAHLTRPDPLGPQHRATTGWPFSWRRLVPFVRSVRQSDTGVSALRRRLVGSWRTGRPPPGEATVNERVHESARERFGQQVIELDGGRSHMVTYRPGNLAAIVPDAAAPVAPARQPAPAAPRRVKIYTVHGTFAHDTDWDDWDRNEGAGAAGEPRNFVNRLRRHLAERGVVLDQLDHTQYNWSGGNSHDERRIAAIGLKKFIEADLEAVAAKHGRGYYHRVFIIAHSHGGTISRLAMNLWDKEDDYHDPVRSETFNELEHDDQCALCMRARNGLVGRNRVPRPDGVITFGSPFVTFEQRPGGLLVAKLAAWTFRVLIAIPLLVLLALAWNLGAWNVLSWPWSKLHAMARAALLLGFLLGLWWLVTSYLPRRLDRLERWLRKSSPVSALNVLLQGLKYLMLVGAGIVAIAWLARKQERLLQALPLANANFQLSLSWTLLALLVLILLVALPGSFLSWIRGDVAGLSEKLPRKYDPAEGRPVAYLSYHTPGDEAGLHLRLFGVLTWVVRTLALSAVALLAFGFVLVAIVAMEAALGLTQGGSLLGRVGMSAFTDMPEQRDRFILLIDALTYWPKLVLTQLLGVESLPLSLGQLEEKRAAAWYLPIALVLVIVVSFLFLMPLVVLAIAIVYLVGMWLRGSGVVFGSESLAWNLANHIAVTRRANANTALQVMFISPEAWWNRQMAHSYYYQSGRVIEDVARRIADWGNHKPMRAAWQVGDWLAAGLRWGVVLFFLLSLFSLAVPVAAAFAAVEQAITSFIPWKLSSGPGSRAEAKPPKPPTLVEERTKICWSVDHSVQVPTVVQKGDTDFDAVRANARPVWEAEVASKFGAEWASWQNASVGGTTCGLAETAGAVCFVSATPCKPRPIACKDAPHSVEAGFELLHGFKGFHMSGAPDRMMLTVRANLKEQWISDVRNQLGAEWTATADGDFAVLRAFGRPIVEECKSEQAADGRVAYRCTFATAPCKEPVRLTPPSPAPAPSEPPTAKPPEPAGRR